MYCAKYTLGALGVGGSRPEQDLKDPAELRDSLCMMPKEVQETRNGVSAKLTNVWIIGRTNFLREIDVTNHALPTPSFIIELGDFLYPSSFFAS